MLAAELQQAARLVCRTAAGRAFSMDIDQRADEDVSRAAVLDLTRGTLRRYGRVQAIAEAVSRRRAIDPQVEAILWCAFYALESGRYADYTVVDQATSACRLARKASAAGFVNAVLRNYLRQRPSLEHRISANVEARYQHPRWWIELLRAAYPANWEDVLHAGNTHPPMCLRVNRRRIDSARYADKLARAGFACKRVGEAALLLERPVPVDRLPGFYEGEVSVQDAGAQRAAGLLDLAAGQRVLDACAAPGGKSAHILELAQVQLTALDVDAARCALIESTLSRLGLTGRVICADCTDVVRWWDGHGFDRILVDAPCSASGVVRRNPDAKWLRRETDIPAFATRQARILDALWRVLAPGGKLLYVTCSVFPEENETVVRAFCARTPDAARGALADGKPEQWLPGPEYDGFYCALLEKRL